MNLKEIKKIQEIVLHKMTENYNFSKLENILFRSHDHKPFKIKYDTITERCSPSNEEITNTLCQKLILLLNKIENTDAIFTWIEKYNRVGVETNEQIFYHLKTPYPQVTFNLHYILETREFEISTDVATERISN